MTDSVKRGRGGSDFTPSARMTRCSGLSPLEVLWKMVPCELVSHVHRRSGRFVAAVVYTDQCESVAFSILPEEI